MVTMDAAFVAKDSHRMVFLIQWDVSLVYSNQVDLPSHDSHWVKKWSLDHWTLGLLVNHELDVRFHLKSALAHDLVFVRDLIHDSDSVDRGQYQDCSRDSPGTFQVA